jgi:protein-L-isoaspartate(D-aspartate) O-methyltransferase
MAVRLQRRRYWLVFSAVFGVLLVLLATSRGFLTWWSTSAELPLPVLAEESASETTSSPVADVDEDPRCAEDRARMVERDLRGRDITDAKVLEAMGRVPRQLFVPRERREQAYADHPLPIGHGQTISQPYIVALMTQIAKPTAKSRVLDIGTGSGYQAAVLGELCQQVYSIEIVKPLAEQATERLRQLGYENITVRHGDGYRGWKEHAPFDVIIVAAAPKRVPQPLIDQLAPGGRLVIPVGDWYQELVLIEKQNDGTTRRESVIPVMFVPMTGEAENRG